MEHFLEKFFWNIIVTDFLKSFTMFQKNCSISMKSQKGQMLNSFFRRNLGHI